MVEFNVQLKPPLKGKLQTVRYTAEFVNADGEHIVLTRERQVAAALLRQPHSATRLLTQILEDFMIEISE